MWQRMKPILMCLLLLGCSGQRPTNLGVQPTGLLTCPDSPNCVNSKASDDQHGIAPLQATFVEAKAALLSLPRVQIITARDDYVHAEVTTLIMRYVDDVELYDDGSGVIQVRSASRLGHSDFGVNRRRIEKMRTFLQQRAN